jgi:hypothetical protein
MYPALVIWERVGPGRPDGLALRYLWRGLILFYHYGFAFVAGPSGRWWRAFSPTDC